MTAAKSTFSSLEKLPSTALAARLGELMTRERHCISEILVHLAEFDRRGAHLEHGYESLFVFCTDHLKMSKGSAYRRTTSARLIAQFPVVLDYLRDGRLGTTSLCELREVLSEENHRELLDRASGLDKEAVKVLAAALRPRPDVPESVRRVPVRRVAVVRPAPVGASDASPTERANDAECVGSTAEPTAASATAPAPAGPPGAVEPTWVTLPPKPTEIEPLSPGRYSIRMSVSQEFLDEFRDIKSALSHVVPAGRMEDVLRECMRIARDVCERRRRGSDRPRGAGAPGGDTVGGPQQPEAADIGTISTVEPNVVAAAPSSPASDPSSETLRAPPPSVSEVDTAGSTVEPPPEEPQSRYISVAVRRAVLDRDERCCTFVGLDGRRCRSTYQLQFHHKVPFALGGPPSCENITLYCSNHNRYQAHQDFGARYMSQFVPTRT